LCQKKHYARDDNQVEELREPEEECEASDEDRGCTGEFSHAKAKKSFGSTYARKKKQKKRHEEQPWPPPKSAISTFDNGGQYPPVDVI
jgi:hypothetical protein